MLQDHANATGERIAGGKSTPREVSLLLNVDELAALLRCSPRHCWRLADAGKLPRPRKLGTLCRWDRAEIEKWITAGCPRARR